jgi:hypothetical protein
MASTVPAQLLAAIKGRKFTTIARLFGAQTQFEAWTPAGHWVAEDGQTVSKIIEVWYSPGGTNSVVYVNETAGARGTATLEIEVTWTTQPDDQPRVLHQFWVITVNKSGKIASARVFDPGLHTEFPEVDLEKQRRAKGIGGAKPPNAAKTISARAAS